MSNKVISKTDYISYAYALTIIAGGIMGYVKSGSMPSLGMIAFITHLKTIMSFQTILWKVLDYCLVERRPSEPTKSRRTPKTFNWLCWQVAHSSPSWACGSTRAANLCQPDWLPAFHCFKWPGSDTQNFPHKFNIYIIFKWLTIQLINVINKNKLN